MSEIDDFATTLLEESKRFFEKSIEANDPDSKAANLHAALMLAFSALEAHVNAIADDFSTRADLSPHDRGILQEQDVKLEAGEFVLKGFKMIRLEERILFMHNKLSSKNLDRNAPWWSELSSATDIRNKLTHPKAIPSISADSVKRAIQAVIDTIDALYVAIYRRKFPASSRGLSSRLNF